MTATPGDDFEESDAQRSYLESSGPGDDDLQSPRAFSAALSPSKLKGKVQEFTENVTEGKDSAAHYQTLQSNYTTHQLLGDGLAPAPLVEEANLTDGDIAPVARPDPAAEAESVVVQGGVIDLDSSITHAEAGKV
jgi:hypothetical protein